MQPAFWINPGIRAGRVANIANNNAAEQVPQGSQVWEVAKNIPVVPGRVGARELSALGILKYSKDDQHIASKTGEISYISPGPGTRMRNAAKEARALLSSYTQSKVRRKLSKEQKRFETERDLALSPEIVKCNLLNEEFDEEVSFCPIGVREIGPRTREEAEENRLHWEHLKIDLREGLSPTFQQYFEHEPFISEDDLELHKRFLVRDVPDGAECVISSQSPTPEDSFSLSISYEVNNESSGGESSFEQVEYSEGSDHIAYSSGEELYEVHKAQINKQVA